MLQPRQLAPANGGPTTPFNVPSTTGGLLTAPCAAAGYAVLSTNSNADANHATSVYVTGSVPAVWTGNGTTPVGQVTVSPTLVNNGGTITVPVAVEADALGPISGSANLHVVSAEAPSVHDITGYAPVALAYTIPNVGLAATGGVYVVNHNLQVFYALLSAQFPAGSQLAPSPAGASLSSLVFFVGTNGASSCYANSPNTNTILSNGSGAGAVNYANYTGTVGSQCDILASTRSAAVRTYHGWRSRNNSENGSGLASSETFPPGVQWLASDVVDIEGVPSNTTFAMQTSFADGINSYLNLRKRP